MREQIKKYYSNNYVAISDPDTTPLADTAGPPSNKAEDLQFYYHPDHLGSSSYITDIAGEVYQHYLCRKIFCSILQVMRSKMLNKMRGGMEYFAFGERLRHEALTSILKIIKLRVNLY